MSECIPSKEVIIRPNDKLWFDSEIRRYIKNRNRQRNIALRKQTPSSWQKYKYLRNKINHLKKSAKKHFFENIETNIEQNRLNNSRNYWKFQQAKFHYTSSTVQVLYQLYTPILETSLVILNVTYLIIMFPLIFKCRRYHNQRVHLFTATRIHVLLFDDSRLLLEQNIILVDAFSHYINSTKRFENN